MANESGFESQADDVLVITSFDEKRTYERHNVSINGRLVANGKTLPIVMCDLSRGGARIRVLCTDDTFSVGQTICLVLNWPLATSTGELHVDAEIARTNQHELGVRFTHINTTDMRLH